MIKKQKKMAACNDCGDTCILISDECLCKYSAAPSISLLNNLHLVDAANVYIEEYTGECDLCEGLGEENYQYSEIIADKTFKRFYAAVIYAFWIRFHGAGTATKAGFSTPQSDDFSQFKINTVAQNKCREDAQWEVVESRAKKFAKYMKTTDCIKCEEVKTNDCGCTNDCTCSQQQFYIDSNSISF